MMTTLTTDTIALTVTGGTSLCRTPLGAIAIGTRDGRVVVAGERGTRPVDVGGAVRALAPLAGDHENGVLAAVDGRGVVEVRFDDASVRTVVALRHVTGLALDRDSRDVIVAVGGSPGRLVRVDTTSGASAHLATGVVSPASVVTSPGAAGAAIVVERTAPARLACVDLRTGDVTPWAQGVGNAVAAGWTCHGDRQLVVGDADGRVLAVGRGATPRVDVVADDLDPVWGIDAFDDGRVVVGTGDRLLVLTLACPAAVELAVPRTPLYLSSWARVGVRVAPPANFDDLVFRVEPADGGLVSHSRDATFDASAPHVLLATGARPGEYRLVAHDATTGAVVAHAPFTVGDAWRGADGPPLALVGAANGVPADATWSGCDPYVPQNIDVRPAPPLRRVAIVVAETQDAPVASDSAMAALLANLRIEVFEHARAYYRRASGAWHDILDAGVVGPVRLPHNWDAYVDASRVDATGGTHALTEFSRAVVAQVREENDARVRDERPPLLDLSRVDSIMVVMRSVPAHAGALPPFPGRWARPAATRAGERRLAFEIACRPVPVAFPWGTVDVGLPVERHLQVVVMPDDWAVRDALGGRTFGETAAHQLAHNLGLADQRARRTDAAEDASRDVGTASLMAWEEQFPRLSAVERMLLGWLRADWVKNLSYATSCPLGEDVVLHTADRLPPPPDRYTAIEVRLGDGRNLYFEYRNGEVVGTEFCSGDVDPTGRRTLLRAPLAGDDVVVAVVERRDDWARVHVEYRDNRPGPQLRPASAATNWKSPDLEVENARNLADARYRDQPWPGHDNWVVATVRNPAKSDAHAVRVDFSAVGGGAVAHGTEVPLGSAVQSVPAGSEVTFRAPVAWVPRRESAHSAVIARVAQYASGDDATTRVATENCEARSNHAHVVATCATREAGAITVRNPFPVPATVHVDVQQANPLARTYVEHAWVDLAPGEERAVAYFTESMVGDPVLRPYVDVFGHSYVSEVPNGLRVTAVVETGEGCHGSVVGGVHVDVRALRTTRLVDLDLRDGVLTGRVESAETRQGPDGAAIVTLGPRAGNQPEEYRTGTVEAGRLRVDVGPVPHDRALAVHFLGGYDTAPCSAAVAAGTLAAWPATH